MAREQHFTEEDNIFIGEDKELAFVVWDDTDPDAPIPLDVAAFDLDFIIRTSDTATASLLSKSTTPSNDITVSGTFNIDPDLNTQKVVVRVRATDTRAWSPSSTEDPYRYSLKRVDADYETELAYGDFVIRKLTTRDGA